MEMKWAKLALILALERRPLARSLLKCCKCASQVSTGHFSPWNEDK